MKKILLVLMLSSIIFTGCDYFTNSTVKANNKTSVSNKVSNESNSNTLTSETNSDERSTDEKINLTDVPPKTELVWLGDVSSEDLKLTDEKLKADYFEMITKSSLDKVGAAFEVDVLNCGGYLFSGTAVKYRDEDWKIERWRIEILPETIALDANEKIKQCDGSPEDDGTFYSDAWAIAPKVSKRKNIITDIDKQQVFNSLPNKTRKWLDQKIVKNPNECCERKEKGVVSVKEQDSWADFDGDGKIDWLKVVGIDKETMERKGDSFTITLVFHRIKGKWTDLTPEYLNEGC